MDYRTKYLNSDNELDISYGQFKELQPYKPFKCPTKFQLFKIRIAKWLIGSDLPVLFNIETPSPAVEPINLDYYLIPTNSGNYRFSRWLKEFNKNKYNIVIQKEKELKQLKPVEPFTKEPIYFDIIKVNNKPTVKKQTAKKPTKSNKKPTKRK